jgi:hypothetical protein
MRDFPNSFPRLYALLGESMKSLPLHFIEKLESLLDEPLYGTPPHLYVVGKETGAPPYPEHDESAAAAPSGISAAAAWMRQARDKDRWVSARFQGLSTVLELLHAVQLERGGSEAEPMLGEHLVEGLLVTGRLLAGHRLDATAPPAPAS